MVSFTQFQSHFSFNPFLLYHPAFKNQFEPNLQSFYPHYQNSNYLQSHFSETFPQNTNYLFPPDSHYVMNPNFSLNSFPQYLPSNQISRFSNISHQNNGQLPIIQNSIRQEIIDKASCLKQQQEEFSQKDSESRNFKKKRGKKLSKKQKKQRQIKRNSVQNSRRNIVPNQIHQILSILFKKHKSGHMVQKLIQNLCSQSSHLRYSVHRFYLYQSLLKEKVNHYANENSLRYLLIPLDPSNTIYSKEEQQMYSRIGLTLIHHFIRNEANITILNSQRIKCSNRLQHMRTKRYLQQFLKELILKKRQEQVSNTIQVKEEEISQ